jgi:hypothetical protein
MMKGPRGGIFHINKKGKKVYGEGSATPKRSLATAAISRIFKKAPKESDKDYDQYKVKGPNGKPVYSSGYYMHDVKVKKGFFGGTSIRIGDRKHIHPGHPEYNKKMHETYVKMEAREGTPAQTLEDIKKFHRSRK